MEKLNSKHFPHVGMYNLIFKLKDGTILYGRYDFNSQMARRWISEDGKEYTSDCIKEWGWKLNTN